jgi:hypothetical protein
MVPETSFHRSVAVRILLEAIHASLTVLDFFSAPPTGRHFPTLTGIF